MNRRFSHIMAVLTVTALVLTGCNGRNKEKDNSDIEENKDPIIVVNNIASEAGKILTDEAGYEKKGSKKAIVQDVLNAADFDVIDVNTDETVLSGRIKYKKDASGEKAASGICDLTSLDKTGKFYIRINTGKVSNVFTVEDDIYKRLLSDRLSNLGERDSVSQSYLEEDISACYMRITDYLLAQEFFPDAISPAAEKETKIIPRTMLLAKSEMDLLKNYMRKDGSFEALLADDLGRQYQYSAVFALFAYEYKEFDKKSSQECAKIAETAYDMAEENYSSGFSRDQMEAEDERYWASAQLYKLTGKASYKETAENYVFETPKGWSKDKCGFLGTMAYLTCYNRVDLDVSEQLITGLMNDINSIVKESLDDDYLVATGGIYDDPVVEIVIENVRLMVLGNYISKNIKYVECGENHLAYLYGRNMLGKDYAYVQDSEYYNEPQIFILAGLIDSYIYEDKSPEAMER